MEIKMGAGLLLVWLLALMELVTCHYTQSSNPKFPSTDFLNAAALQNGHHFENSSTIEDRGLEHQREPSSQMAVMKNTVSDEKRGSLNEKEQTARREDAHGRGVTANVLKKGRTTTNPNPSAYLHHGSDLQSTDVEVPPTAPSAGAGLNVPTTSRLKLQTTHPDVKLRDKQVVKKSKQQKKPTEKKSKAKGKQVKTASDDDDPPVAYFQEHFCPSQCSCFGRVVQCSDRKLENIPYGIPYNSRYILLMNNHLSGVPLNMFSEYLAMEFLVLSNNRLVDRSVEGAFNGIQNLKRLYLERNLLQSVPSDLPTSLEELRLDGNGVKVVPKPGLTRCPALLILSLNNNSLVSEPVSVPNGVFYPLSNLRTLSLSYNRLTSVPLNLPLSLQELYLRGNLIQRIQAGIFQGRAQLQMLDLSANRLTDKGLGKSALGNCTLLESLNLEGNLLKQVPRYLPSSLKTLSLEGNSIFSITKATFLSLPHLEHLGLARNKISKVAPGAFQMLPLLHQLDLSHNFLQQVPRQLPAWLVFVALQRNKIQMIPRDAFCSGPKSQSLLVRVQLENNLVDMSNLDSYAFRCLRGSPVVHFQ